MAIIRYFLGGMYAGKSSYALDVLLSSSAVQKIVIAPTARKRGFVSRNHPISSLPKDLYLFESVSTLPPALLAKNLPTIIMIDEVQFIEEETFYTLLERAKEHPTLHIILAGLSYDQHGEPFANQEKILRFVPQSAIRHLTIHCATCPSDKGEISIRKWISDDRIVDDYAVLCRTCFDKFYTNAIQSSCHICQAPTDQHLRQWHQDDPQHDRSSALCQRCYTHIKAYGKHH
ncbi:hypothetical protein [Entomospira culicis]|uniref:thymidine kinase n=1 Tax=Entomospira culicis TaxID=2719989 RepID=A0A968KV33_9SPIO|nr:hypothetical protein [Entomospira culicis]NIZ19946.1 hypothetical protein [Entomospira culicis]NIZ70189.1 hypothetical protein [Entomospira culicis]WDI38022.1 hypothetical protein PVA46_08210 [Entomospira culicis]WDI39645.1 hypothetical protein PVA47_08210 [Entomospira culicis]